MQKGGKCKDGDKGKAKGQDGKKGANPQDGAYQNRPPQFDGNCNNCGKYGHKAADCWSEKKKPAARPKGGKKGNKGRGKGGKAAGSFEEHEQETSRNDVGGLGPQPY